jgi:hypothetical protein
LKKKKQKNFRSFRPLALATARLAPRVAPFAAVLATARRTESFFGYFFFKKSNALLSNCLIVALCYQYAAATVAPEQEAWQ